MVTMDQRKLLSKLDYDRALWHFQAERANTSGFYEPSSYPAIMVIAREELSSSMLYAEDAMITYIYPSDFEE